MTADEFAERERRAVKALATPRQFTDWLRHKGCCEVVGKSGLIWKGPLSRFIEDTLAIKAGFNGGSMYFSDGTLDTDGFYVCGEWHAAPEWCDRMWEWLFGGEVDVIAGEAYAQAVQAARE
jgi:hypothetical protein